MPDIVFGPALLKQATPTQPVGHRCGYIRHNGTKSWNEMTVVEREEHHEDMAASCCYSAHHVKVMKERR